MRRRSLPQPCRSKCWSRSRRFMRRQSGERAQQLGEGVSVNSRGRGVFIGMSGFFAGALVAPLVPWSPLPKARWWSSRCWPPRRPGLSRGRLPDRAGGDEEFALLDTIRVVKPQQSCRGAALGGSRLDAAPDELEMDQPNGLVAGGTAARWLPFARRSRSDHYPSGNCTACTPKPGSRPRLYRHAFRR